MCNPLNLEYRYQIRKNGEIPEAMKSLLPKEALDTPVPPSIYREAADPTVVLFKDTYYLFASMSGGFWYSDDLYDWQFKETPELPIYDYAPDVRQVGGAIVFSASRRGQACSFYRCDDPLNKPFELVSTAFAFWDPDIFEDDDGRVYFYWGCSNTEPIYGIEVEGASFAPIGEKTALIQENEAEHGWERFGENNIFEEPVTPVEKAMRQFMGTKPYIEGAFMTKHGGLYYLQYAAPGTQYNVYSDGVYVGKTPLGPFAYQAHNPFSSKPGGFMAAAGHGSTFEDKYGNWWHVSTMRISVNHPFERRIGLFPCYFDADGVLFCNQNFADYPFVLPQALKKETGQAPKWMLLSYGKPAAASSHQAGHEPCMGTDEDVRTWWAAQSNRANEWYQLDLGSAMQVHAVQVNFADYQGEAPHLDTEDMAQEHGGIGYRYIVVQPQKTEYRLEYSEDGEAWQTLLDRRGKNSDLCHDFVVLDKAVSARYLRIKDIKLPFASAIAISGLRVFGTGNGLPPESVGGVQAQREAGLDIKLKWQAAAGAIGYNVRYGIMPDKLYSSWQFYNTTELRLGMANKGSPYYIAVDSFNENGVAEGGIVAVEE